MKINIRSIIGQDTDDKPVDVKRVMEGEVQEGAVKAEDESQEQKAEEKVEKSEAKGTDNQESEDVAEHCEQAPKELDENSENQEKTEKQEPEKSDDSEPEEESEEAEKREPKESETESAPEEPQEPKDHGAEPTTEEPEVLEEAETDEPVNQEPEEPKESVFTKEKAKHWAHRYGWLTGIAAAFAVLIAFMVIYTTMVPRDIHATINDEKFQFTTKEYTIEGFLQDEKIEFCDEDYMSVPMTAFVYDGMRIKIDHATDFSVTADGKTKKYKTLRNTVKGALKDAGIHIGEMDIISPDLDAFLTEKMHIVVQRVEVKREVVEEAIPFATVNRDDTSMHEGDSKVVTEGKDGKDKVTYEVTYVDGAETARAEVSRESISAVVDKVIANGTMIDYNGKTYSKKLVVKAYAYTGGGRTAMGTRARVGEIAVDPRVISLGTNVYIEGVGARRAEDTGGNIKGNTIDIYMNSESECRRWGVRYVTIYIE